MDNKKVQLIYIAGYERSGTTIIHNVLSQQEGFFGIGESRDVWLRGFQENKKCGCSQMFHECEFWSSVASHFEENEVSAYLEERNKLRNRHLHKTFIRVPWLRRKYSKYTQGYEKFFELISRISGSRHIVESSKSPLFGAVLAGMTGFDVKVIHVVRDPRAVDYSMHKRKSASDIFDYYNSFRGAFDWSVLNFMSHVLKFKGIDYLRLNYEDFCKEPDIRLAKINKFLGVKFNNLVIDREGTIELKKTHTVAGSGQRYKTGIIQIKDKEVWKNHRNFNSLVTSILTLPLRLYYYNTKGT